jgi:PcfJ-like protein
MSHCVASYKELCVSGAISIWSLTCETASGEIEPRLTIELYSNSWVAQCRGFANRKPSDEEAVVVKRWADAFGLDWSD